MPKKKIEVTLNEEQVKHLSEMLFDYTYWVRDYYTKLAKVIAQWETILKTNNDKNKTIDLIEEIKFIKEQAEKVDIGRLRCDSILLKCREALGITTDLDEDINARRAREKQARNTTNEPDAEVSEGSEVLH